MNVSRVKVDARNSLAARPSSPSFTLAEYDKDVVRNICYDTCVLVWLPLARPTSVRKRRDFSVIVAKLD
jgi:predicted lipoprotein with Yx(FWY)xxD motif